jgi:predicted AAA+ superfamily ATPase
MRKRLSAGLLARYLRLFPAVALLGPRQCGKTTLARSLKGAYWDLEQPSERLRLDLAWDAAVAGRGLMVLDEAQEHPAVFGRLRGAIDADRRRRGRFLLLGSVSPALQRQVAESLAGRLGILELGPFGAAEVPAASLDRLWLCGGFPDGGVLRPASFGPWQQSYLQTLTQRDLPAWGLPAKPGVALRLLRMLAASQGSVWNASQIGAGLGLSYNTVNAYTDFLEGAFLVRRLRPWHANLGKRLVKAPKVYLRDSGLLHSLLGLGRSSSLLDQPWVGVSWEGFVIEQVLGALRAWGIQAEPHYFRTSDGHELDLLLQAPRGLHAVEVKLSAQPQPEDLQRARKAATMVKARSLTLICRKDLGKPDAGPEQVLSLPSALLRLKKLLV